MYITGRIIQNMLWQLYTLRHNNEWQCVAWWLPMNITLVTNFIVPSSLLYAPEKRPQSHQRVNVSIFPTLLCVRSYSSTWPLMLMPSSPSLSSSVAPCSWCYDWCISAVTYDTKHASERITAMTFCKDRLTKLLYYWQIKIVSVANVSGLFCCLEGGDRGLSAAVDMPSHHKWKQMVKRARRLKSSRLRLVSTATTAREKGY